MIGGEYVGIMGGPFFLNGRAASVDDCPQYCRDFLKIGDVMDYSHSSYRVTFVNENTVKSVRIS